MFETISTDYYRKVDVDRAYMTPSEKKELEACLRRVGEILYNDSDSSSLETLETIENTVRAKVLEHVSPENRPFFSKKRTRTRRGKKKKL